MRATPETSAHSGVIRTNATGMKASTMNSWPTSSQPSPARSSRSRRHRCSSQTEPASPSSAIARSGQSPTVSMACCQDFEVTAVGLSKEA